MMAVKFWPVWLLLCRDQVNMRRKVKRSGRFPLARSAPPSAFVPRSAHKKAAPLPIHGLAAGLS